MGKASKDRRLDDKCAMALDRSVRLVLRNLI